MGNRINLTPPDMILIIPALNAPVAQLDRVPGYEPGGREFESLRARQLVIIYQAVIESAISAFCFNIISAGVLPDFPSQTLFAASINSTNSGAE